MESNGCLSRVTEADIAAARNSLPEAAYGHMTKSVEVDSPVLGRISISFRCKVHTKFSWGTTYHWQAVYAEQC